MGRNDYYKGSLEALVLQLIAQNGESYGYELTQKALATANGQLKITEGTLYPLLHKLENEGTLTSSLKPYGARMRKYYKLTPQGKTVQQNQLQDLREFIAQLQHFINPKLA